MRKHFFHVWLGDTHSLPSPAAGRNDSPHELTELSDVKSKQSKEKKTKKTQPQKPPAQNGFLSPSFFFLQRQKCQVLFINTSRYKGKHKGMDFRMPSETK